MMALKAQSFALGLILALPGLAWGQDAPPLPPYAPPPSASPLAPLPGTAPAEDGPLGDVRAKSNDASNVSAADTRSLIAPALPDPGANSDTAAAYLRAAQDAIKAGQTGTAQEALERAESRLLDRDVAPSEAQTAITTARITHITAARQALSVANPAAALAEVSAALGS